MDNKDNLNKEEKNTYIYPGTVFTAKNYDPFTKQVLSHPFVCVYDQGLDLDCQGETNIMALLITSNNKQYSRQIAVSKAKNPFLEKDSFAYCNNIYMFLKKDVHIIGQLDSDTFFQIIKKRQQVLRSEDDQCVQALMNMKAYESKNRVRARAEKQITSLSNDLAEEKNKNKNIKKAQDARKKKRNVNRNANKVKPMVKNNLNGGPVDTFSFEPEFDPNYKPEENKVSVISTKKEETKKPKKWHFYRGKKK